MQIPQTVAIETQLRRFYAADSSDTEIEALLNSLRPTIRQCMRRGGISGEDLEDLERWCLFHQQVEQLPPEEREVVGLIFYHEWTQAQVAELFQVNVRTVRRRWESAMQKLWAR